MTLLYASSRRQYIPRSGLFSITPLYEPLTVCPSSVNFYYVPVFGCLLEVGRMQVNLMARDQGLEEILREDLEALLMGC